MALQPGRRRTPAGPASSNKTGNAHGARSPSHLKVCRRDSAALYLRSFNFLTSPRKRATTALAARIALASSPVRRSVSFATSAQSARLPGVSALRVWREASLAVQGTFQPFTLLSRGFARLAAGDARRVAAASIALARARLTPSRRAMERATALKPGCALLRFATVPPFALFDLAGQDVGQL